jgi:FkbM family methyltransferase
MLLMAPVSRTQSYFFFCRAWHSHWPFALGAKFPVHLEWAFGPFVPVWFQVKPGVTMLLDPNDLVSRDILAERTWEPATLRELERHIPVGGTFIDVGAHIGWYSLNAAKDVGPKGRVIAVEPNRETLAILRQNIRASGASSVILVAPVACSDSETTLTFYAADRSNSGASSLSAQNASQAGRFSSSYPVRARRLDDIVKEAGVDRVDAIKIDVEGAEFLVLKGAADALDRYKPVVSVELLDDQLKSMGSSADEVVAYMRSHGYEPAHIFGQNMIFSPVAAR